MGKISTPLVSLYHARTCSVAFSKAVTEGTDEGYSPGTFLLPADKTTTHGGQITVKQHHYNHIKYYNNAIK